ncbi:1,2-phenylacetyl-CoA epoxidase subunit PaaC [Nocardioides dongkuii]|uniref:1,2-phenylacetyl-CoA epoxidase subunit PaaC n=1 Tax=Nocardioides dongkuii TaxID=2760089 RepID=UPI0015FBFE42|nr:1,2-phenylacetyl-CoA epoxidase subunit PaaC [Nocardioides dongkuii]
MSPTSEEGVYDGLLGTDPAHWAFGTGFADPLEGIDPTVPDGVDRAALAATCLALGDDALVLSHRLSEWCSRAPELEDDIALANVALDLLGQARLLLARAAVADPSVVPALPPGSPVPAEDALAFFRAAPGFRCSRAAALANGDFAHTVVRLFCWSAVRLPALQRLAAGDDPGADPVLAAVAAKGVKEVAYHRDWSSRWVLTLARGTEESRRRTEAALGALAPAYDELVGRHPEAREDADLALGQLLDACGLPRPSGTHDLPDDLPALLAELQSVARAHPMAGW